MALKRPLPLVLGAIALGATLVLAFTTLRGSRVLLGKVLEGDDLLHTQIESDFDRDGDVDFLDFTVFSAFYEENV